MRGERARGDPPFDFYGPLILLAVCLALLWAPVNPSNYSWRTMEKKISEYKSDGLTESPGKSKKEGQEDE